MSYRPRAGNAERSIALRRALTAAVLAFTLAAGANGANLGRYTGWEQSPEAYFLTRGERALWSKIQTEGEADRFVRTYFEQRGSRFGETLRLRIAMADKFLTNGKIPGSQTLRGKVVIVLGPPAKYTRVDAFEFGGRDPAELADLYTNVGPMSSRSTQMSLRPTIFTFIYNDPAVSALARKKSVVIRIEFDPRTGHDRLEDRRAAAELDQLLAAAVEAAAAGFSANAP